MLISIGIFSIFILRYDTGRKGAVFLEEKNYMVAEMRKYFTSRSKSLH